MEYKIEIKNKKSIFDPLGNGIKKGIQDLGIKGVTKVNVSQVFIISGDIMETDANRIAGELLADPITEEYIIGSRLKALGSRGRIAEIAYNPGATPRARSQPGPIVPSVWPRLSPGWT